MNGEWQCMKTTALQPVSAFRTDKGMTEQASSSCSTQTVSTYEAPDKRNTSPTATRYLLLLTVYGPLDIGCDGSQAARKHGDA